MELISGENFQSLAQISFYTERNCIIDDQIKAKSQNLYRIADFSVNDIKQYNKIFIYTHFVKDFFAKFGDHLAENTTIISHNSDDCIDESFRYIADNSKLKIWFCQNRSLSHEKVRSIPIGIANSQWPHGNQQAILQIKDIQTPLNNKILAYKNFSIGTNRNKRSFVDILTQQNGFMMQQSVNNIQYLINIHNSEFVFSPPGNGLDCHRIWECITLGSIPIVERHECFSQWVHLPILFVDDWSTITEQSLKLRLQFGFNRNLGYQMINMDYWKKII